MVRLLVLLQAFGIPRSYIHPSTVFLPPRFITELIFFLSLMSFLSGWAEEGKSLDSFLYVGMPEGTDCTMDQPICFLAYRKRKKSDPH